VFVDAALHQRWNAVWDPASVDCRIGRSDIRALELKAAEPHRWLASLQQDGLVASAAVENGPNLITGATIADLFADLAEHWRGWSGQKVWENNEHTLRLEATHDGLGHVGIDVHLTSTRTLSGRPRVGSGSTPAS
jgi:hypothetical protein